MTAISSGCLFHMLEYFQWTKQITAYSSQNVYVVCLPRAQSKPASHQFEQNYSNFNNAFNIQ